MQHFQITSSKAITPQLLSKDTADNGIGQHRHNEGRQQNAERNRRERLLKLDAEQGRNQGAGPCAGTRKWDAYK